MVLHSIFLVIELTGLGTYDELAIIPGNFTVPPSPNQPPKIPKKAMRVCRIYVSQRTTVYNGRLNWNIAKHLARFDFSHPPTPSGSPPPAELTFKVFPAGSKDGDGALPFFACTLTPFTWIPPVPINTSWMPLNMTQVLPPIPAAAGHNEAVAVESEDSKIDPYDINPRTEASLLVGTENWTAFPINAKSRARGCWVKVHELGKDPNEDIRAVEEASKYWPQGVQPWSIGAWMEDSVMEIPQPIEWKL
jgi:hypothetical protein